MKYKKQFIFLAFLIFLAIGGCGKGSSQVEDDLSQTAEQKESDHITIGMTLYSLQNEYIEEFANAASDYAKEKGIELKIYDGNYDASMQISQVEEMIQSGVDGIILNPQDAKKCSECVDLAYEAKIPIISVNTQVENEKITSYVGSDDVQAGEMIMQKAAEVCKGKGNIVILEGPLGQSAQLARMQGMKEILKNYPDIHIIGCKTANWSRLEAKTVMENWLNTFDRIDVIIAENDGMALGAVDALADADIQIPTIGIDGHREALQAIEDGRMLMTVYQDAEKQAQTALGVLLDHLTGKEVKKSYLIPLEEITQKNVKDKKVSEK